MLDKQVCTIGCLSNSRSLPIALNSMVKYLQALHYVGSWGGIGNIKIRYQLIYV